MGFLDNFRKKPNTDEKNNNQSMGENINPVFHPLKFLQQQDAQTPEVRTTVNNKVRNYDQQNSFLRGLANATYGIGVGAMTGDPFLAAVTSAKMGYDGYKRAEANNSAYEQTINELDAKYKMANELNHLVNDKPDASAADLQKVYDTDYYDDYTKTYSPEYQKVRSGLNTADVQQNRLDNGTVNFNQGYISDSSVNNIANDQIELLKDAHNKGNFQTALSFLKNKTPQQPVNNPLPVPQEFNSSFTVPSTGLKFLQPNGLNGGVETQQWQGGQPNLYNLWNAPGYNSDAQKKLVEYSALNPSAVQTRIENKFLPFLKQEELTHKQQENKYFPLKQQYDLNRPYFNPNQGHLTPYQQWQMEQAQDKAEREQLTNYNNYKYLNDAVYSLENKNKDFFGHDQPGTDEDYKALGFKGGRAEAILTLQKMKNNGWGSNSNQNNDPLGIR